MPNRPGQIGSVGFAQMDITSVNRDVKAMLQKTESGYFSGEGDNVGKQLEDWLEKMDDFFDLAHSTNENKEMMAASSLRSPQNSGGRTIAARVPLTQKMQLGNTYGCSSSRTIKIARTVLSVSTSSLVALKARKHLMCFIISF